MGGAIARWVKAELNFMTNATCNTDGAVPERDLATRLGVDRHLLKTVRARDLTAADWFMGEGGAVWITDSGREKIRGALRLPEEEPDLPGALDARREPVTCVLTVFRQTRNPHIVEMVDASGAPARLRVKSPEPFVPGLKVPGCVHISANLYDFRGKLPRRRGLPFPEPMQPGEVRDHAGKRPAVKKKEGGAE